MTTAAYNIGLFVTCPVDLMRPEVGFASVTLLDDRYQNPRGQYRDILVLLKINGYACELQINIDEILIIKEQVVVIIVELFLLCCLIDCILARGTCLAGFVSSTHLPWLAHAARGEGSP